MKTSFFLVPLLFLSSFVMGQQKIIGDNTQFACGPQWSFGTVASSTAPDSFYCNINFYINDLDTIPDIVFFWGRDKESVFLSIEKTSPNVRILGYENKGILYAKQWKKGETINSNSISELYFPHNQHIILYRYYPQEPEKNIGDWSSQNRGYFVIKRIENEGSSWGYMNVIVPLALKSINFNFTDIRFENTCKPYYKSLKCNKVNEENADIFSEDLLFPVPFKDELFIENADMDYKTLEVFDGLGNKIFEREISKFSIIPTSTWADGVYYVALVNGNKRKSYKVIKIK